MRRGCEDDSGFGMAGDGMIDIHTLPVNRNRGHIGPHDTHHVTTGDMARIFVPYGVALTQQDKSNQHKSLLRTRGDDDLRRIHLHPPRVPQMARDCGAQIGAAMGLPIAEVSAILDHHRVIEVFVPDLHRKQVQRRNTGSKAIDDPVPDRGPGRHDLARAGGGFNRGRLRPTARGAVVRGAVGL